MKKKLLTSLSLSLLAFTSISQTRGTGGVLQNSFNSATPQQNAILHQQAPRTEPGRPSNTSINRAPCVDTLLFEDFQSQTIPATWINLDLDGATDANGRPQDWFVTFDQQSTIPGDTNWVSASSSWFTPLGTANNVLILDAVQPCASTILRWQSAPFEGPAFMDGYEVRVSTTGTNITDFTTTLFTVAESVNGTATPSSGTPHTLFNGNNGLLQTWEVSLGAYDNQTIYIAFFHDSNDDNLIQIDNIFMGVDIDYDMEASDFYTEPYYSTPLDQVTPRTFSTEITLANGTSVTNPTAFFEAFQGTTSVFGDATSVPSLAAGNSVTLTSTAFTPSAIDTFEVFTNVLANENDPNPSDNMDSLIFVVSDSVFSTSDNNFNGSLGIGVGASGFLGNEYPVTTADVLTSITFTLSSPVVGDTVVGIVYDMVGTTPNQIIAMTAPMIVPVGTPTEYTLPIIGGGISVTPGNYVVGLQESVSQNISIATNTEYYVPGLAWVFFNGSWSHNEDFSFFNTYLISANFGPSCPTVAAAFTESTNGLAVNFTDASTNNDAWLWDFGDGNTSTSQNPTHTYAAEGTYTACLIAASNCDADTVCTNITVTNCANPVVSFTETMSAGGVVDFTNGSTTSGTATYSWDFGDGQTATTENPTNTYAANGTYTVCLTVTDSCGSNTTCNNITVNTIGIDEQSLIENLSIFPIPAQEMMTISNLTSGEDFTLELLNNLGQVVKIVRTNGLESVQFDLSNVVDGYYHLRISNASAIGTRAVMIKH